MTYEYAIVANDAGAANHIVSWLLFGDISYDTSLFFMTGPAQKLMSDTFPDFVNNNIIDLMSFNYSLLISGTGWSTNIEWLAREISKRKNVKVIAVIDHWVNYEKRFIYEEYEVLPDEIWVTDQYAEELAIKRFPKINIVLKNNRYLDEEIKKIQAIKININTKTIVYVIEPIRVAWNNKSELGEFQAFDYFYDNLNALGINNGVEIIIKPHPSDKNGKYDDLIKSKFNVHVDAESSLSDLVARASVVVGCHTYAMVIALHAGCRVVCSIPKGVNAFNLPYSDIEKLSDVVY